MAEKVIRVQKPVSKATQSAWLVGLTVLLIIKIFVKVTEAFYFRDNITYLIALSTFALLFAIALAGVLLRQPWGIGLATVFVIIDIILVSYVGTILATTSVIIGFGILLASFFVYRYTFDK